MALLWLVYDILRLLKTVLNNKNQLWTSLIFLRIVLLKIWKVNKTSITFISSVINK